MTHVSGVLTVEGTLQVSAEPHKARGTEAQARAATASLAALWALYRAGGVVVERAEYGFRWFVERRTSIDSLRWNQRSRAEHLVQAYARNREKARKWPWILSPLPFMATASASGPIMERLSTAPWWVAVVAVGGAFFSALAALGVIANRWEPKRTRRLARCRRALAAEFRSLMDGTWKGPIVSAKRGHQRRGRP